MSVLVQIGTYLASNAVALLAGGYLGYKFGPHVESLLSYVLGLLKRK